MHRSAMQVESLRHHIHTCGESQRQFKMYTCAVFVSVDRAVAAPATVPTPREEVVSRTSTDSSSCHAARLEDKNSKLPANILVQEI